MRLNEKKVQLAIFQSKKLCSILEQKSPIETMRMAFWNYFSQQIQESHEAIQDSFFLIEYLQSLFISIDSKKKI